VSQASSTQQQQSLEHAVSSAVRKALARLAQLTAMIMVEQQQPRED